jgi:hypothetical protein
MNRPDDLGCRRSLRLLFSHAPSRFTHFRPFNTLPLRSNDMQKVIDKQCYFCALLPRVANQNPRPRFVRLTLPRPPASIRFFPSHRCLTTSLLPSGSSRAEISSPQLLSNLHLQTVAPVTPLECAFTTLYVSFSARLPAQKANLQTPCFLSAAHSFIFRMPQLLCCHS